MKVRVDADACTGHGRCYALVPDVFDSDDEGHSVVRFGSDDIPVGLEEVARMAAMNCPEKAITCE